MTFGLLDRGGEGTAGLTAPRVTIAFGAGGSGGLGGLAGDIGGALGIGGVEAPALEAGLVSLHLSRAFAPGVDWADLVLFPVPGGASLPALGDAGSITISSDTNSSTFTATLDSVEHRADGSVRLGLGNGGRVLAQARAETSFAEQTPGAIIDALCAEAGVQSAAGGAGESLPRYVVDAGTPVLAHVARLAEASGRLAHFDDSGTLQLHDDAASGEEIALTAGGDILDFRLTGRAGPGAVRVDGAGAADQGSNAWAWLRKTPGPTQATAGTAPPQRMRSAPHALSQSGAKTLAAARARSMARHAAPGQLLLASHPEALPGSILALAGTPADGSWFVLAADLRFDCAQGFTNTLRIARLAAGGGGGLPGGFL